MKERIFITVGDLTRPGGPSEFARILIGMLSKSYNVDVLTRKNTVYALFVNRRSAKAAVLNSNNLLPLLVVLYKFVFLKEFRIIFILHGKMGKEINNPVKKMLARITEKICLRMADKIVVVSEMFYRDEYSFCPQSIRDKFVVIPNPVELKKVNETSSKQSSSKIKIVYSGGIREEKGYDLYLNLISDAKFFSGFDVEIIALGFSATRITSIENLTIIEKPYLSELEFEKEIASADVFISPSKYETFGIALGKAYILGCKIVAFKKTGILNLIKDDENVFVFDSYNYNSFSLHVKKALDSQSIRKYRSLPSSKEIAEKYIELIENW